MEPNTETKTHAKPAKIPRIGHPARDDCRQADCTQCPQMPANGEQKRKNSADNAAAECRCAGRRRRMKPVLAGFRPAVNAAAALRSHHAVRARSQPCRAATRAAALRRCRARHRRRFAARRVARVVRIVDMHGGSVQAVRGIHPAQVLHRGSYGGKTKAIGVDCEARHGVARFACSLKTRRQPSLRMMRSIILPIFVGHAHTAAYEP